MCFPYRLDNDGESQNTDIAQPLSVRALSVAPLTDVALTGRTSLSRDDMFSGNRGQQFFECLGKTVDAFVDEHCGDPI
jgi:hypothetical protein